MRWVTTAMTASLMSALLGVSAAETAPSKFAPLLAVGSVFSITPAGADDVSAQQATKDLPGLGATKKAWKRSHKVDKQRKLQKDCCYLPRVRSEGRFRDTWVAVLFDDPPERRVLGYTRIFADGTNESTALGLLKREDLPADAAVAWEKEDVACKIVQFTSATLATALGSDAQQPQVALISSNEDAPYSSSRILNAIVGLGSASDQDVTC
jgi:hypothetical protein